MADQNVKNHARYIPLWHIVTALAILAGLAGSIVNLVNSSRENLYSASLLVLVNLVLLSLFWYARAFALRAQDRAIRAEESLRHYLLTGKPIDSRLRQRKQPKEIFRPERLRPPSKNGKVTITGSDPRAGFQDG
jgi:hypothetical protein